MTTKTEQVSADYIIYSYFELLLLLDVKFKNTFHKSIEYLNTL